MGDNKITPWDNLKDWSIPYDEEPLMRNTPLLTENKVTSYTDRILLAALNNFIQEHQIKFGKLGDEYIHMQTLAEHETSSQLNIRLGGRGGYLTWIDPDFKSYDTNSIPGISLYVGEGPKHTIKSAQQLKDSNLNVQVDIDETAVPRLFLNTIFNKVEPTNIYLVAGDAYENKGFADYFSKDNSFSGYQVRSISKDSTPGILTYSLVVTSPEQETANLIVHQIKDMPSHRPGIVRYPEQLQQAIQIAIHLHQLQYQLQPLSSAKLLSTEGIYKFHPLSKKVVDEEQKDSFEYQLK